MGWGFLGGGERKGGSNFRTPSLVHWCGEHRPVMPCPCLHDETAGPLPLSFAIFWQNIIIKMLKERGSNYLKALA